MARTLESIGVGRRPIIRFVLPTGDTACDDSDPLHDQDLPTEARLVKYLRIWRDGPDAVLANGRSVQQEISSLLERFICGCLAYDPSGRLGNWWSDGVIQLDIEKHSRDAFSLRGVTWIGSEGLAPFDIDVEISDDDDRGFSKCLFRIGLLDRLGRPTFCEPGRVVSVRPRPNSDWAMAVELTPPEEAEQ